MSRNYYPSDAIDWSEIDYEDCKRIIGNIWDAFYDTYWEAERSRTDKGLKEYEDDFGNTCYWDLLEYIQPEIGRVVDGDAEDE